MSGGATATTGVTRRQSVKLAFIVDEDADGSTPRTSTPRREGHPSGGGGGAAPMVPCAGTGGAKTDSRTVVNLADLPDYVANALRNLDVDGDGVIDMSELTRGNQAHLEAVRKTRFYRKLFVLLFLVFVAQLGATCGVLVGLLNYTKVRAPGVRWEECAKGEGCLLV